jgi:hypothetical protein
MADNAPRKAGMTQDLKTWLAAMPPEEEIEARISEVETELELLTTLRQVRSHARAQNGEQPAPVEPEQEAPSAELLRKRLSPERVPILRAILAAPDKRASIPQIVDAIDGERTNIASNMQRMVPAELLAREGRGLYTVTPGAEALIREMDGGQI